MKTTPLPRAPSPDLAEIRRTLAIFAAPDLPLEIRALGSRRGTVSGYFNDLEAAARAAVGISGKADGVYITLNPPSRDLLARSCNRLREFVRSTTSDDEIVARRWFLVDCDPVRPAGISSTDQERGAAIQRAYDIREHLRGQEFPEPLVADSGNGAHLLYRWDMPNDAATTEVLRSCLAVLASQFDDNVVNVDRGTFNASRISKLYGTASCKGDPVPELGRIHRIARLLEVPSHLEAVLP